MPTAYEFFHTNGYPLPRGIRKHGRKKITAVSTAEEKGIGETGQAVGVMLEDGTILTSSRVFGGLAQSEEDFAVLECLELDCHDDLAYTCPMCNTIEKPVVDPLDDGRMICPSCQEIVFARAK